jgi:hypothetical protein
MLNPKSCQAALTILYTKRSLHRVPPGVSLELEVRAVRSLRKEKGRVTSMRQSRAAALGAMCRQNAAGVHSPPSWSLRPPSPFAQDLPRPTAEICSTHLPSKINRIPLKTNHRATFYPSQNRRVLSPCEPRNLRPPHLSAKSTSRGFRSRKELECNRRFESQTWKSEGGFSWQLILL